MVAFLPAAYMMFSVVHYFSFRRAFGIDHFDPAYRTAPLVRQGIFRWTPNAHVCIRLFRSVDSGLAVPVGGRPGHRRLHQSHAYIWVHYFYTEKPDMKRIYG